MRRVNSDQLRNIIFGIEDSLVSTVGFLFGLASANEYDTRQIILAGIVLIAVEALSMGAGSYLTETEVREIQNHKREGNPIKDGLLMFASYILAGLLVLSPYFILSPQVARFVSVGVSVVSLFLLGFIPTKNKATGLRMVLVAGSAILVGFLVAVIFSV